jgi:hypothetical protein
MDERSSPRGQACPHVLLAPRWDHAASFGDLGQASAFVCDACGRVLSRSEGLAVLRAAGRRAPRWQRLPFGLGVAASRTPGIERAPARWTQPGLLRRLTFQVPPAPLLASALYLASQSVRWALDDYLAAALVGLGLALPAAVMTLLTMRTVWHQTGQTSDVILIFLPAGGVLLLLAAAAGYALATGSNPEANSRPDAVEVAIGVLGVALGLSFAGLALGVYGAAFPSPNIAEPAPESPEFDYWLATRNLHLDATVPGRGKPSPGDEGRLQDET